MHFTVQLIACAKVCFVQKWRQLNVITQNIRTPKDVGDLIIMAFAAVDNEHDDDNSHNLLEDEQKNNKFKSANISLAYMYASEQKRFENSWLVACEFVERRGNLHYFVFAPKHIYTYTLCRAS